MSKPITTPNAASVEAFIDAVDDPKRRADAAALSKLMADATGERATMWGSAIVGYGRYVSKPAKGEGNPWMLVGFSPRKAALVLYGMSAYLEDAALRARIGPGASGDSCVYVKSLGGVDAHALREMITRSYALQDARHNGDGGGVRAGVLIASRRSQEANASRRAAPSAATKKAATKKAATKKAATKKAATKKAATKKAATKKAATKKAATRKAATRKAATKKTAKRAGRKVFAPKAPAPVARAQPRQTALRQRAASAAARERR